ncbi:MAG: CYTH domain-containing protein [Cyanobacteriota bacterium]|nr:CYTH domain-containing protein [Cyanobacteriota bacterium]
MALEIERRFLVSGEGWKAHVDWQAQLQQGYLLTRDDGLTTRVRLQQQLHSPTLAWLTVKAIAGSEAPDHGRLEFEYPIPVEDGQALLNLAPWRINKTRYGLLLPEGEWVLDVFTGENAPLVIAEVEVQQVEDTPPIPSWCVREITGLHQLSNAALAQRPWQQWTSDNRQALLQGLPVV